MTEQTAPCVLVADDDPTIRLVLLLNLEAEGMRVQTVDNGWDTPALARELQPDLVVLDIMMPGCDGFLVLHALKADPATADIPVVLLSARASDDDIWQGWQAGADYYITKPFNLEELLHFVDLLTPVDGADPSTN